MLTKVWDMRLMLSASVKLQLQQSVDKLADPCTKFEVSRFTHYEAMNGGAKCRKWGGLGQLGGTQGHGQRHHLIERIWLPTFYSTCNRNHVFILYLFRDITGYLSKVADFDPPTCMWRPHRGWPRSNFTDLWRQKTRVPGISCGVVCVILRLAILVEHRLVTDKDRAITYTAHA